MTDDANTKGELDVLRAQVNQLLRTEARLYQTKAKLDRQLLLSERLQALNLQLIAIEDLPKLGHLVAEFVTGALKFDAAVFVHATPEGHSVLGFDGVTRAQTAAISSDVWAAASPSALARELGLAQLIVHVLLESPGLPNGLLVAGFLRDGEPADDIERQGLAQLATQAGAVLSSVVSKLALRRERASLEERVRARTGELAVALEEVTRLSRTDALTGLTNRRAWLEHAEAAVRQARRYGHELSLILVDVDHFKRVNDTRGHQIGDDVLIAVSRALAATVRDSDLVGRLGGEEFVVLLPETAASAAAVVAERCREAVRASSQTGLVVTASFGIATYPHHGDRLEVVLANADAAMYAAKERGRDGTVVFEPG
jgi:diguanylate cyclase (GGDEF)-like protein